MSNMNDKTFRMEVLRLAMNGATNANDALALAERMLQFVDPAPVAIAPEPVAVPIEAPVTAPQTRWYAPTLRGRKRWRDAELHRAAALLDAGVSPKAAATMLGRTDKAIYNAVRKGIIPVQSYKVSEAMSLRGLAGKLASMANSKNGGTA